MGKEKVVQESTFTPVYTPHTPHKQCISVSKINALVGQSLIFNDLPGTSL